MYIVMHGYLLALLPNLLVGLAYIAFLRRPLRTRLLAALPSAVFLLIPVLGLCLASLEIHYAQAAKLVGPVVALVYIAALALVAWVLVRIQSWLNLAQVVNVIAGTLLWYVVSLVLSGGAS